MSIDWDYITKKLDSALGDDKESLARVLFYLGQEDKEYSINNQIGPMMKILNSAMDMAGLLSQYAHQLADDTKKAGQNEEFKRILGLIYAQMLEANKLREDNDNHPDLPLMVKAQTMTFDAAPGLVRAISLMPLESQTQMLEMMSRIVPNTIIARVEGAVQTINKAGGAVVTVALASVLLTYEAIINIKRWWKGEISGKRCCKNIIDSVVGIGGSIGGGFAGVAAGSFLGPVGMIIGGIGGGIAGGELARALSDLMTQKIFDVPKTEALENAYNYFNLRQNASNHAINQAYHAKCLQHHPDKGGSAEQFHMVQMHLATIKVAKGELY